jgi:hypothetical protein
MDEAYPVHRAPQSAIEKETAENTEDTERIRKKSEEALRSVSSGA